jgi:hypothetical protein
MEITRAHKRAARKMIALRRGDVIGAFGGPLGIKVEYRNARRADWMRKRFYAQVETASHEVLLWCCVEATAQMRCHNGYRNMIGTIADYRYDMVSEIREASKWVGMLSQLLNTDADSDDIRTCAGDLLDQDFGSVWKVGLWSNMTWQRAHAAADRLRDSAEWEMAAALCRNAPVSDLDELHALSKAVTESQRQGLGKFQGIR